MPPSPPRTMSTRKRARSEAIYRKFMIEIGCEQDSMPSTSSKVNKHPAIARYSVPPNLAELISFVGVERQAAGIKEIKVSCLDSGPRHGQVPIFSVCRPDDSMSIPPLCGQHGAGELRSPARHEVKIHTQLGCTTDMVHVTIHRLHAARVVFSSTLR